MQQKPSNSDDKFLHHSLQKERSVSTTDRTISFICAFKNYYKLLKNKTVKWCKPWLGLGTNITWLGLEKEGWVKQKSNPFRSGKIGFGFRWLVFLEKGCLAVTVKEIATLLSVLNEFSDAWRNIDCHLEIVNRQWPPVFKLDILLRHHYILTSSLSGPYCSITSPFFIPAAL